MHTRTHAPWIHTHLSHSVLNGRPGEQQAVPTLELQQDLPANTENKWRDAETHFSTGHVAQHNTTQHPDPPTQSLGGGGRERVPGAALERLRLIQDHVLPLDPLEVLHVLHHQLVAGDDHVERRVLGVQGFLRRTHTQRDT